MAQERIPFDIKFRPDIEAGKYLVETRGECSVRIICWEYEIYAPIIAKVEGWACAKFYRANGRLGGLSEGGEHSFDLFLVPNPDYKEPAAEQGWSAGDEEMLDAMIDIVSNSLYEPLCPREGMLVWLKSLPERFK